MINRLFKLGTIILTAAVTCTVMSFSLVSHSDNNDPLVTLSYLNDIILPQMKQDILTEVKIHNDMSGIVNDNFPTQDALGKDYSFGENSISESDKVNSNLQSSTGTYTLLELEYGKCVYSNSALEFIVRPGSDVRAISPFSEQGIADITKATEYLNGDIIPENSYCLIPRGADGRGFQVFNDKSYILIRGEYYIG